MTDLTEGPSHHSCEKIDSRSRRHMRRVISVRRFVEKETRTSAPFHFWLTTLFTSLRLPRRSLESRQRRLLLLHLRLHRLTMSPKSITKAQKRGIQERLLTGGTASTKNEEQFFGMTTNAVQDKFLEFHPLLPKGAYENEEEQTFDDFIEIGQRPPNEFGTGRFRLTKRRRQISIVNLAKSTMGGQRMMRLTTFLQAFFFDVFTVKLSSKATSLLLSNDDGAILVMIEDKEKGIGFPLKVLNGGFADVFSVFDVLVEYVSPKDYTLVALVDIPIGEEFEDGDDEGSDVVVEEVLGRACGDRVAVVHCDKKTEDVVLFTTIAHELLHTMGFDHTTFWTCLMNPGIPHPDDGSPCVELAPHNLKKLQLFLQQENNDEFVIERYRKLNSVWYEVFPRKSRPVKDAYEWLNGKIRFLGQRSEGTREGVSVSSRPKKQRKQK